MKRCVMFSGALAALCFLAPGCRKVDPSRMAEKPAAPERKAAAAERPAPYKYPPPVSGRFKEINIGGFDLVDGIAYTVAAGPATVVYAVSKPIASPVLADSPCPMTQARFLTEFRDAGWVEVSLDAKGSSNYFAAGQAFDGRSVERGAEQAWMSRIAISPAGRASGAVQHRRDGRFKFDLPVFSPRVREATEAERVEGRWSDDSEPRPAEAAVSAAYDAAREAARRKDLKALLSAQGFSEKQIAAIRGLEGIDADFAVYADRFLEPGTPGDFTAKPGTAYVRSEGVNSKGKKFANYYHYSPCGDALVLASISENPQ
jgi:hypothetical protein